MNSATQKLFDALIGGNATAATVKELIAAGAGVDVPPIPTGIALTASSLISSPTRGGGRIEMN